MLLSCKLNCCVVPHMPGRRKKRDGNLNYWLSVFRMYNSFSSFSENFFFFTFVLLILLRSWSDIKILLPELREKGRQPILGQANCSSGQPSWAPHHEEQLCAADSFTWDCRVPLLGSHQGTGDKKVSLISSVFLNCWGGGDRKSFL